MPRVRAAFSLIELLTCIAVIAVLTAIVISGVSYMRVSTNKASGVATMRSINNAIQLYVQEHNTMPGPTWTLQNAMYTRSYSLVNYLAVYLGEPSEPTLKVVKSYVPAPLLDYVLQDGNDKTIVYEANNNAVVTGPSGREQSIWAHIQSILDQPEGEAPIAPFNMYSLHEELIPNEFWILRTCLRAGAPHSAHPEVNQIFGGERVVLYLDGHVEMSGN